MYCNNLHSPICLGCPSTTRFYKRDEKSRYQNKLCKVLSQVN